MTLTTEPPAPVDTETVLDLGGGDYGYMTECADYEDWGSGDE